MAMVEAGGLLCDADLVVFDKDGTLLDFEFMWGRLLVAEVAELTADTADRAALASALYRDVGYDPIIRRTLPRGPWSMATTDQVLTILAATLYRHGHPWPEAEAAVRSTWQRLCAPGALPDLVRPTADLVRLFSALRAAGARIAVDTTDERRITEETLRLLGIERLVDFVSCGDDDLPAKPSAERLLTTCCKLGVAPKRTVMVGDTAFDLLMGRGAGVGLTVGVLSGVGDRETLAPHADVLIGSVGDIGVRSIKEL
jgi:phosphoglycolate phosphatase-like HAD superfamily hydrolase